MRKQFLMAAASMVVCPVLAFETEVYRTSPNRDFAKVEHAFWSPHTGSGAHVVDLDSSTNSHSYFGLGISFPGSSTYLLSKLPSKKRRAILEDVFSPKKLNLSVGRIHCGSSDYAMSLFSYNDTPDDIEMKNFSIDEDKKFAIPVIREIADINPAMYFFSSPWSPPAWMKDNQSLCGGSMQTKYLDAYGNYVVNFLEAYRREGIDIKAYTVQNEPSSTQAFNSPTCIWSREQECEVIANVMPKKVKAAGLKVKPWLFDHNFDETNRVMRSLADENVRKEVEMIAWHPYSGKPEMIRLVHAAYPDIPMLVTEMGPHIDRDSRPMMWWADLVLRSINAGCGGFVSWCLILDEEGQPNISRGFGCAGFVELNSKTGEAVPSEQYRMFRHVSPFVRRGAQVLIAPVKSNAAGSERVTSLLYSTFKNPDGSYVVVLACPKTGKEPSWCPNIQFQIKLNNQYLPLQMLAGSITTVVIRGS